MTMPISRGSVAGLRQLIVQQTNSSIERNLRTYITWIPGRQHLSSLNKFPSKVGQKHNSAGCQISAQTRSSGEASTQRRSSTTPEADKKALEAKSRRDVHRRHLETFGKVSDLRRRLGLDEDEMPTQRPTVFVSIDTETERLGLLDYVSEVGISILDARELDGIAPGPNAVNWFQKMRTMHWRLDYNNPVIKKRMRGDYCLFCKSENLTPKQVQYAILQTLEDITSKNPATTDLVLVGHTIDSDLRALKSRPLFLKLTQALDFAQIFDTVALAASAEEQGARFEARSLGSLLPMVGADRKYCQTADGSTTLRGWHNAGNDAAYTMMLLVQFALRWKELLRGTSPPRTTRSSLLDVPKHKEIRS